MAQTLQAWPIVGQQTSTGWGSQMMRTFNQLQHLDIRAKCAIMKLAGKSIHLKDSVREWLLRKSSILAFTMSCIVNQGNLPMLEDSRSLCSEPALTFMSTSIAMLENVLHKDLARCNLQPARIEKEYMAASSLLPPDSALPGLVATVAANAARAAYQAALACEDLDFMANATLLLARSGRLIIALVALDSWKRGLLQQPKGLPNSHQDEILVPG
eukprot:CAMPEP_0206377324 /NCGR_PEP_ID=MMETSP0294-20121207/10087_1 /ASSEMBLY_ACC=CAM_ASM_000327 /TAXON_ID=39354 /ORGANISM="Heterosigma akashiwo, Strain CCMP2393" /LENGTH=213 /DNA_ID=CAMNT_0053825773 /DNA_START=15 /DNA_END=653 /DNA_ORIENTATION=-